MRPRAPLVFLACALALLTVPSLASGGAPPNPNDPCARNFRDTCGTAGVGSYKVGRYGQRWYGDFTGAVAGVAHAYCIDLRFWYPSRAYHYRESSSAALTNRAGQAVSAENEEEIAYALARFGQSSDPNQAAATMLYVHSLMGDARPGELDPTVAGPTVVALYARIAGDSQAYHGPYRIDVAPEGSFTIGKPASMTVRVLSATGKALPGVALSYSGDGVSAGTLRTSSSGAATLSFTPASTSPRLSVSAAGLPSTLPRVFVPTTTAAAPNGQRLVAAGTQQVSAALRAAASKRQLGATSTASPATLAVGEPVADSVTIMGAAAGWRATVTARVYGPFALLAQARCTGASAWSGSFVTNGPGTYTSPAAKLALAGWYTFVETVPSDAVHVGLTTACGIAAESFKVQADPALTTVASAQRVTVGTPISDRIHVQGLAGQSAAIDAMLYGPFASTTQASCTGSPVWSGTVPAATDGDYTTAAYTPALPGIYTYREEIDAADLVRPAQTLCGEVPETVLVVVHPQVTTAISAQTALTGSTIDDRLVVSGLGSLAVSVRLDLFGPFATAAAVKCSGTPFTSLQIAIPGDGTYTSPGVILSKAGIYTYLASIAAGPLNDPFTDGCGKAAETVVVTLPPPPTPPKPPIPPAPPTPPKTPPTTPPPKTPPKKPTPKPKPKPKQPVFKPVRLGLTTAASDEVVRPGSAIYDRIHTVGVRGVVKVELFGPFSTRGAIRCTGRPAWTGQVTVDGDGETPSPVAIVKRAGFYGFRERVLGSNGRSRLVTACAVRAETSLAAPLVITGRGDSPRFVPVAGIGAATPTHVLVPSLGVDAPISPVGIDVAGGALGVPSAIHRVGWWRDGAAPGAPSGALLLAGHVDSAVDGAGAFFGLRLLRAGDRVEVETAGGRRLAYRVSTVELFAKADLPTSVWSQRGPARLVLVTCGGRFDAATAHYLDNVVVIATPL